MPPTRDFRRARTTRPASSRRATRSPRRTSWPATTVWSPAVPDRQLTRLAGRPAGSAQPIRWRRGSQPLALRGAAPRRGPELARGEPSRARPGGRGPRRRRPLPPRLAAAPPRGRLGRYLLAEGVRRPRRDPDRAGDLLAGDGPGRRAAA